MDMHTQVPAGNLLDELSMVRGFVEKQLTLHFVVMGV